MRRLSQLVMLVFTVLIFTCGSAWSVVRFVDLGDGTVLDTSSQLRWLKNANCKATLGGIGKYFETLDWYSAETWSRNVASGACGLTDGSVAGDWRQPTKEELQTLSSISSTPSETLNATGFFNNSVIPIYYGTSSTDSSNEANAYSVYMGTNPFTASWPKSTQSAVWPVRSGLWVVSAVSVAPAIKDFGAVTINTTSVSQVFTISNNGAAGDLSVSSILVTGGDSSMFVLDKGDGTDGTCGAAKTLGIGASCTVSVAFNPTAIGTKSTTLRIVSNDVSMTNKDVSLSGDAVSPPVAWWKGDGVVTESENYITDSAGGHNGTIYGGVAMRVAENQTATLSCGGGGTIAGFDSVYGADPNWVSCGSCTIGSSSCSVAYNNIACGDPYPLQAKQGQLSIVCGLGDLFVAGKVGQAFNFEGSTTIVVPHAASFDIYGTHAIAFWVKPAAYPAAGKSFYLVNKWTFGLEDKLVAIDSDGKLHYILVGTSASSGVTSATAVQTNVWTHVVATYDGANMKIYLNGVLDASVAASGDVLDSTGKLYLGYNLERYSEGVVEAFNGQLDEVRWYDRSLSSSEVSALSMVPDAFSFTAKTGMPLNAAIVSNPVTITGITAAVPILVTGGEYSVSTDYGSTWSAWTNTSGTVAVNNQVRVRLTSSSSVSTLTSATLTVGSVSGVFNVTTAAVDNTRVIGPGLVSWWRAENNADDTLGGNNGTIIINTVSATVAENQTATVSCNVGSTITSFTSLYGLDPD